MNGQVTGDQNFMMGCLGIVLAFIAAMAVIVLTYLYNKSNKGGKY